MVPPVAALAGFRACNLIWILLAAYLGGLMAKQRSLRREIDAIKTKLGKRGQLAAGTLAREYLILTFTTCVAYKRR